MWRLDRCWQLRLDFVWCFWLVWHACQWAYAIMICPSCVIVVVISVDNILKIMNFLKSLHFALFGFTYITKILILYLTYHPHIRDTHRQMDTHTVLFSIFFCFLCHTCQRNKFYIWYTTDTHMHRYRNTCTHMCRDTGTCRYRYTQTHAHRNTQIHMQTYTDTCIFVHSTHNTHTCTHMHTDVHVWNLRKLLLQIHF